MSVEIRINDSNEYECDWGVIEHSEPRPDLAQVGHLMVTTDDYLADLLTTPGAYRIPPKGPQIGLHSATENSGRLFAHHDYNGRRWTWELFPAHFADGKGPEGVYVGRWPD